MESRNYIELLLNQNKDNQKGQKPTLVGFTRKEEIISDLKNYGGILPTDFALSTGAMSPTYTHFLFSLKVVSTPVWIMDSLYETYLKNGEINDYPMGRYNFGGSTISVCPTLKVAIPKRFLSSENDSETSDSNSELESSFMSIAQTIGKVRTIGKSYQTIEVGEYPQTIASKKVFAVLEELYNSGDLKQGLVPTGKFFEIPSGFTETFNKDYPTQRLLPEFEYKNQKYVRVRASVNSAFKYSNGMSAIPQEHRYVWIKVEPVKYIIRNWDKLPTSINPNGDGTCNFLDLRSEKALTGGVKYSLNKHDPNDYYIKNFLNGITSETAITEGDFENRGFINDSLNLSKPKMIVYEVPKSQCSIQNFSYDGCCFLDRLVIGDNVVSIAKNALYGTKFKYVYSFDGNIVFDKEFDKTQKCDYCFKIDELQSTVFGMDNSQLFDLLKNKESCSLVQNLRREKISIPYDYIYVIEVNMGYDYWKTANLKFFKELNPQLLEFCKANANKSANIIGIYNFLVYLGCISNEYIKDKHGKDTQTLICQKAVTVADKILKEYKNNRVFIDSLDFINGTKVAPSAEFLSFISQTDENGKLFNMEMLMKLEKTRFGVFAQVMRNFDSVAKLRKAVNEKGKIYNRSWEECCKLFMIKQKYRGIEKDNEDIANEFLERGMDEESFMLATKYRKQALKTQIPHHILSQPLSEKTILEEIEEIRSKTKQNLTQSKKLLEDVYKRQFSYEFLDKYDPKNFIMGLLASCCAVIDNEYYGSQIVKATAISPNVQNIVVRDSKNQIVAKCSIYINREFGFGVINDFEINEKFRADETFGGGVYYTKKGEIVQSRQAIFDTFMRAINAFVERYDKENPDRPIRQINVGMGYNRLKKQTKEFEEAVELLPTPNVISFEDTYQEQRIIYKRDSTQEFILTVKNCDEVESSKENFPDSLTEPLEE